MSKARCSQDAFLLEKAERRLISAGKAERQEALKIRSGVVVLDEGDRTAVSGAEP